jgi:hypothetical protein
MQDTFRDGEEIARSQKLAPVLQIDVQLSLKDEECFVAFIMPVPMEIPVEDTDPDDVIIDLAQDKVLPIRLNPLYRLQDI